MGSTRDRRYNLTWIVQNSVDIGKPIVAVSIAYRLGPWGFLTSQEVADAGQTNIGLRDQRLALHWIQENIAAFGGEPKKVTIWGESAGAGSVGWHLLAYNGRDDGLFSGGIMQSGNPVNYGSYQTNEVYQPRYDQLVNATDCHTSIDTLDCLRRVPVDTIQDLFNSTPSLLNWGPVVDGDFIARWGSIQLEEGAFVKVPIIDGANSDEGTSFGPRGIDTVSKACQVKKDTDPTISTIRPLPPPPLLFPASTLTRAISQDEEFAAWATNTSQGTYAPAYLAQEILDAYPNIPSYFIPTSENGLPDNYTYPAGTGAMYRRTAAYGGDLSMIANRRGAMEAWAAHNVPAYSYRFNTIPNPLPLQVGVTHFQEVAFVFDNTLGLGYDAEHGTANPFANKSQSYQDLAEYMR
jgi:carboxylesterase type B